MDVRYGKQPKACFTHWTTPTPDPPYTRQFVWYRKDVRYGKPVKACFTLWMTHTPDPPIPDGLSGIGNMTPIPDKLSGMGDSVRELSGAIVTHTG